MSWKRAPRLRQGVNLFFAGCKVKLMLLTPAPQTVACGGNW
jgi:hypothetical protein